MLLKEAPVGAYLVDADFRIAKVNQTALPVFGNIPNLIGRDFDEVIHILWPKEYADEVVHRFRHTLATGEPFITSELTKQRLDRGVTEYYEWRIDRIPLPDGRWGVVCYFQDLSATVKAREEIARSEERFRAFVTASSDVVYQLNADWSEMRRLSGRDLIPDSEDPARSWFEKYIHPDDRAYVLSVIRNAIRTKSVFELEHRVIRADGTLGWTFSRAVPLLDSRGEVVEWFGAARDVTERKRAEEALARLTVRSEQQRRFYEAILSSTPDLIYVFDLNHRFTYANQALLTMWGKTAEEAIGKNCLELGYEPWHAAMHDREIEHVIATKQPIRGDVPFSGTHGRRIYDYIFVPVLGMNGEVEAVAGSTRDVTDRHSAEEELRRANQDLEQFAYAATHDLQEPLRSVKIYSELLERRYAARLDGNGLELLNFVRDGATRMEMLIRDLLSYTRVGRLEALDEKTDANACFELAVANLAAAVEESGATVISDSLPCVSIPSTQLQQVFQNLIGNAIKYRRADASPVVHISAEPENNQWRFTVADNGIGIQEEYKDRVFGLFKRLHTNEKYSGTGIGLALCQRIVERNHGRIWVESELGKGSQFHFTLPA
jgi:hypothetical protein